jgi:aryl-alcohol dehydrogenase-like predicted oxidoreductase
MKEFVEKHSALPKKISPLAFGSWGISGEYWGPQEHKDSVRAIHKALNLGVNHFDTAPVYGKGRSEQLIGQQLKKIRQDCIIASKAFYSTPEKMQKSLETSLNRLLTDYLDIFYIHWPLSGTDMRPGMEMLERMRRQGRIRAIGVSNFSIDQIEMVREAGHIDVYQGGYSVLWPGAEQDIIPYCRKKGISYIPYGILAQGLLTDKGQEKLMNTPEGFRHKMILFHENLKDSILNQLSSIRKVCHKHGWAVEHAVILYTQERTESTSILLGTRNRAQAERNFQLPGSPLPGEIRVQLDNTRREIDKFLPKEENMFGHKS